MEPVTSADGTRIAYEREGSGPPLVLVHGTTADHTRWEPVRPALAEHFTVYALDRRGRGASGDAEDYRLEREVEDITAVVGAIDAPPILLGHSFGALVALEAARRTALRGLVLYEPVFPIDGHVPYSTDVLAAMERLLAAGEHERVLEVLFGDIAGLTPDELARLRSAPNWPARVEAAHTVLRESYAEMEYAFEPARFADMHTPTLLLSGSESPPIVQAVTAAIDAALPDSRIVVFEGHGHVAMNTASEQFVEELVAFADETA